MQKQKLEQILKESFHKIIENEFHSTDVSDLQRTRLHKWLRESTPSLLSKCIKSSLHYFTTYQPNVIRKFINNKGFIYPQGQSKFIRAHLNLIKKGNALGDLSLAEDIADWLIINRNKDFKNYCWGQPFLWFSRKPFPPNLPRATVSSQVAWAFLDLFSMTGNQKYLDVASSVCDFYLEDLNYERDKNGNFCFSYTTIDNYHIHNSNLLAASVLSRVGLITDNERYKDAALRAANFSISHQNEDGSWYYWAPPDKLLYTIDNYHTGFNLEALQSIYKDFSSDEIQKPYQKGMEYYLENMFISNIPKYTNKRIYPIDIQSCAQSIITFSLGGENNSNYKKMAESILEYTIKNFYLPTKNHFGYRKYKVGYFDKSYYFRWGDAWMQHAISLLL